MEDFSFSVFLTALLPTSNFFRTFKDIRPTRQLLHKCFLWGYSFSGTMIIGESIVKKGTLLNGPISRVISLLGHGDSICIGDTGPTPCHKVGKWWKLSVLLQRAVHLQPPGQEHLLPHQPLIKPSGPWKMIDKKWLETTLALPLLCCRHSYYIH